jgi:assimilatory nitrate reductase catalytic subunit
MTRTGLAPRLMAHRDEPYLELHPHDAMKLGIGDGDLVRVQTAHADTVLRALVTDGQRIGEVFAPMHWTDRFTSSGPVDRLVSGICDPVSGQPELKATAARLSPVPTLWRGLLVGEMQRRDGIYHARIPTEAGQIYEIRGWQSLPALEDMADWADRLIGRPGQRLEVIDPLTGAYRFANIVDGRLESCLMISAKARFPLPDRADVTAMIGAEIGEAERAVFATVREAADVQPVRKTVCVCFGVDHAQIEQAIRAGRLTSAPEIGKVLKAGTNCGSCIPELKEILRDMQVAA